MRKMSKRTARMHIQCGKSLVEQKTEIDKWDWSVKLQSQRRDELANDAFRTGVRPLL